ncbi:hypothetical protein [Cellulomonas sp. Y8]|uniref:hypothetical protein n=1 Tax=Cellulomonas sp. Y8 TaxID=2591145 RepID=UPI003D727989
MRSALRRVLAQDARDRGLALPLVIGITAALAALMVAGVAFATGALRKARDDQDWSAALAAAYAGVEEYESRLANDTSYFSYGNTAAQFSAGSDLTLPTGAATNPAFGLGLSGTWATVAGSGGASQFRYEVDNSTFASEGRLRLRSTGRSGGETRTIVADLKQQGFIDFLYFTDYEVMDPTALNPDSNTNCQIRYPSSRPGCQTIYFGGKDVINGPLHTNDAIQTNGAAQFNGKTSTSWKSATGKNFVSTGSAPVFKPGDPSYAATIGMPATNSQLKKETRSDLPIDVPVTGCLYTGPTSITFSADGQMTVISPWTKFTNTSGDAATAGTNPARCGTPGATGLAKKSGSSYVGQSISVPNNLVIFVQNVPTEPSNVNYTASSLTPPGSGAISCASSTRNNIGYPTTNEVAPFTQAYGCRNGDVFVKGTLDGRTTVSAENYVYVTDNLVYEDEKDDMLGLVGQNAVWVWNPVRSDGNNLLTSKNRTVHAAILSVQHTFMVQNYDQGANRGTLTVKGAIAQKFRGPVATGSGGTPSTGYAKDYNYDTRFYTTAPPKFLSPVTTTYGITVWVEVSPAFAADGSYR